jgi:hypothetical protein
VDPTKGVHATRNQVPSASGAGHEGLPLCQLGGHVAAWLDPDRLSYLMMAVRVKRSSHKLRVV